MGNKAVFNGYTETQLRDAFDKVANPADPLGRIDAVVTFADASVVGNAIVYFTGVAPDVEPAGESMVKDGVRFRCIGYRAHYENAQKAKEIVNHG
jgi:hypothetical protein